MGLVKTRRLAATAREGVETLQALAENLAR